MNIEKMKKLKEYILAEPARYEQNDWLNTKGYLVEMQNPPCGTVACLAGNACMMEGYKPVRSSYGYTVRRGSGRAMDVECAAIEILGLSDTEQDPFAGDAMDWFSKARTLYQKTNVQFERHVYNHEGNLSPGDKGYLPTKMSLSEIMTQRAQAAAMQIDMMIVQEEARLAKQASRRIPNQA